MPVSLTGGFIVNEPFLTYNWSIENSFSVKRKEGLVMIT